MRIIRDGDRYTFHPILNGEPYVDHECYGKRVTIIRADSEQRQINNQRGGVHQCRTKDGVEVWACGDELI